MRSLRSIRGMTQDARAFLELGGSVQRTHPLLERVFPDVIWGHPLNSEDSPIHLTFDDGPSSENTPYILDVLFRHNVQATFFLTGGRIPGNELLVERMMAEGHAIGYHGLTHESWWLTYRGKRELEMNPRFIEHFSTNPFLLNHQLLLRAPFGRLDFAAYNDRAKLDALFVHWRLAIGDWVEGATVAAMARILYRYAFPGDIVLLHDHGPSVTALAAALDMVIPMWKNAGQRVTSIQPFLNTIHQ